MAAFYFKVIDNDGTIPADDASDFQDLIAAIRRAKIVLAEMALDGLPQDPVEALVSKCRVSIICRLGE